MKKKLSIFASLFAAVVVMTACTEVEKTETDTEQTETTGETNSIVISGDVVSEQGGCVLSSRFSLGDKIIFRNNIVDGTTGEQVVDAKVQVHLSTGEVLDMAYGEHGDDKFWVVAYPVTAETPTGVLEYKVTASYNDASAEWEPFNVAPSKLQIVSDTVATAGPAPEKAEEEVDLSKVETNQKVEIIGVNFDFKGPNDEKTFYVKAGEEVTLSLKSEEGVHGLAISDLKVNLDKDGEVKFTPEKAGEYDIVCSVFCGAGHGDMKAKLVVVE
ncbi:hypothetical protein [Lysinibacillus sp. BW-2-10]|uniref:hypothetical protein n=1 Tax=Lysinibacillus sp. BW-2-10 TaxID=2590030 RepID=UPI00117E9028|nr:hypothetical protein [Lysinibacillus sp. BW-2-10]TSI06178.1 hypothetical protein FJQ64_10625 [Lysinibacillus sp. BW-2-10]